MPGMNEADTCRRYVVPKLQGTGWDDEPHRINEQVTFTDGRIVVFGRKGRRRPGKRADYVLRYRADMPIAVVEAKASYATPGQGLQQAKDYAEILGLKFAYATNGHGIVEFYFDGGHVEITAHIVYELDADGNQLRVVRFTDYTAERVRTLYTNAAELRNEWADPEHRQDIIDKLAERGIDFDELATAANRPDADPLDLLCHVAFNAPLRTRRERAQRLRSEKKDFFEQYGPEARGILNELLDKYTEHGTAQFVVPEVLEVPPISERGNVMQIARYFGGEEKLVEAIRKLQTLLYAA